MKTLFLKRSFDSSVGRAEDCRSVVDILRSLVRFRLEGIFYLVNITDSSHATYSKLFYSIFWIDNYFPYFIDISWISSSCSLSKGKLLWNLVNPLQCKCIGLLSQIKLLLGPLVNYSACVVYLSVGESAGYVFLRFAAR